MRYLLLTYYKKPTGKIDEVMTISKKLKIKDWQMTNVILDFKELKVLKCSLDALQGDKDWNRVVSYYYKYYPATCERLFLENGHELKSEETQEVDQK